MKIKKKSDWAFLKKLKQYNKFMSSLALKELAVQRGRPELRKAKESNIQNISELPYTD